MSHASRVRGYFEAFADRDWERLAAGLAPGFTFTSQYDDHIGVVEFRRKCWEAVENIEDFELVTILEEGNDVMVRYRGRINGQDVQNIEHLVFEKEKLAGVTVFFGRP